MYRTANQVILQPQVVLCVFILVTVLSGGRIMSVYAELPSDLAQGIGILSKYKSSAEGQAEILVVLAAENEITKDEYRKGQSLYVEAKAVFDGWIDQLIFEVQSGKTTLLSPQVESMQLEARVKGEAFTKYAQKLFLGDLRGGVGDGFLNAFGSLKEAALSILKGFSKVSPTDQPEVIKRLEGYKWPEFHAIEQRSAIIE